MPSLKLTELIDVKVLQRIQDGFSKFTGMASLTTDAEGTPVTEGSDFREFCINLRKQSELGCRRCKECDKKGAIQAQKTGRTAVYECHAGLVDYAAPIMVNGVVIGSFLGGQIRTEDIDEEKVRRIAVELGLDEDAYLEEMQKVVRLEKSEVEKAAEFLADIASTLSEMAYNNYKALQKSRRLERAARSQTAYIIDMNSDMQNSMRQWMENARRAIFVGDFLDMRQVLKDMLEKGPGMLASIEDTVEYAKMTGGEIELNETEYNIDELLRYICKSVKAYEPEKHIEFSVRIDDDVPECMLGDAGRIGQVVSKLLMNAVRFSLEGMITITVSCQKKSYAVMLRICIQDSGKMLQQEEIETIEKYIQKGTLHLVEMNEESEMGFSIVGFLLRQMNGTIEISSKEEEGSAFTISLPQLKIDM